MKVASLEHSHVMGRCSVGKLLLRRDCELGKKGKVGEGEPAFILYAYQSRCLPLFYLFKICVKSLLCFRHGSLWSTTTISSFTNLI